MKQNYTNICISYILNQRTTVLKHWSSTASPNTSHQYIDPSRSPGRQTSTKAIQLYRRKKQAALELRYFLINIIIRKVPEPIIRRLIVRMCFSLHSSVWSFTRILQTRIKEAQNPPKTPRAWAQQDKLEEAEVPSPPPVHTQSVQYHFDETKFNPTQIKEMKSYCEREFLFPAVTRPPTKPEPLFWFEGMLSGTIVSNQLPTFLRRCCSLSAINHIGARIRAEVEGELLAVIPQYIKIRICHQSSIRPIEEIDTAAERLNSDAVELAKFLDQVKEVSYHAYYHTIHFFLHTQRSNHMDEVPNPL